MPAATLTSKGQLTLPKKVREILKVHAGDVVDFIISADGDIRIRAGVVDASELRGMLHRAERKPITLEQMDEAIARARGRRP